MNFETFLRQKRIHPEAFREQRPALWEQFRSLYQQIGSPSFDLQKKFYFNDLRALFPLPADQIPEPAKPATKPKLARPKLHSKASDQAGAKPKLAKPAMRKPSSEEIDKKPIKPKLVKPKLAQPVMKKDPGEPSEIEKTLKPKLAKPVMKKPTEENRGEQTPTHQKPKLAKPVMKKPAEENRGEQTPTHQKPKLAKPVMKPKPPAPSQKEEGSEESDKA